MSIADISVRFVRLNRTLAVALVSEIDFTSTEFYDDPCPQYTRLRERGPLLRDERGLWLITDYATCADVLHDTRWGHADRDPATSSTQAPAMRVRVFPDLDSDPWPFMRQNPPDHTRVRALQRECPVERPVTERQFRRAAQDELRSVIRSPGRRRPRCAAQ